MRRVILAFVALAVAACSGSSAPSPGPSPAPKDPMQVCLQAMSRVPGAVGVGAAGQLPGKGRVECGYRTSSGDTLAVYEVGQDGVPHPATAKAP